MAHRAYLGISSSCVPCVCASKPTMDEPVFQPGRAAIPEGSSPPMFEPTCPRIFERETYNYAPNLPHSVRNWFHNSIYRMLRNNTPLKRIAAYGSEWKRRGTMGEVAADAGPWCASRIDLCTHRFTLSRGLFKSIDQLSLERLTVGKVHRLSGCATFVKMNPLVLNSKKLYVRVDFAVGGAHTSNPLTIQECPRQCL